MARYAFKLPDIGEGIAEAEIVAWHVKVGDRVAEDDPLCDMMTDKATVEMTAPVSGVVREVAGEVGDQVAIGSVLAVFETDAAPNEPVREVEKVPKAAPSAKEKNEPSTHVLASPAVRQRAKNLGIDLAQVKGEGARIRHADLDAFLTYNRGYRPAGQARADEQIKVVGLRRRIAETMAASKRAIPHFTYIEEFDVTKLEALRADLNDTRGDKDRLTILPFLIVAICKALPAFPMINARYDDEANVVTRHGAVHLGIATQTDAGLMVPVLRDAQDRNIWQLAAEVKRLAEAARAGKAAREDLSGSTLTLTSLGPLGGIASTPVINRPEVAIIGPNKVMERPIVRDGGIAIGKVMNLSIACDHRVIDGYDAASFVQAMKKLVETPALLFVD